MLCLILIVFSNNRLEADTLIIHQVEDVIKVADRVDFLKWQLPDTPQNIDSSILNYTPEQITPHPTDELFSYTITFKNNTGKHCSFYLKTFPSGYTKVFVEPQVGAVETIQLGESLPISQRSLHLGNYTNFIPIEIPANQYLTVHTFHLNNIKGYVKTYKTFPINSLPRLIAKAHYNEEHHEHRYIEFSMVAAMLALVLYNLIVFFKTKSQAYIYYVLHVVCFVLYYLFQSQIGFEYLWGEYPWFHYKGGIYFAALSAFFAVLFFQNFVRSRLFLPVWDKVLTYIGSTLLFVVLYLGIFQITKLDLMRLYLSPLSSYLILLSIGTIFFVCILAIRQGSKEAKFYLFTAFILIVSAVLHFIIGSSSNFGKSLILIGYTSQSLMLSFGLANSINRLKTEVAKQRIAQVKLKEEQAREKQQILEQQKDMLQSEVTKRTAELVAANDELFSTVNKLNEANELLANQQKYLEGINRKITSSIHYAQRIQVASLPSPPYIKHLLPSAFVLFLPRDIVSGDFYWFGKHDNKTIVIAADSTGHGVPGAFMSLIGIKLLDHIIGERKVINPTEILAQLDIGVESSLSSSVTLNQQMNDGMDIAICVIDHEASTLSYAGAHNPIFIVRNDGQVQLIKADKMPIGNTQHYHDKHFTTHTIPYTAGDTFYLYSDGFYDQFGGEEGRKYYPKRFKQLLEKASRHPIAEQKDFLANELHEWKGEHAQVDDILVMGVKL